jgi:hypothetical protein
MILEEGARLSLEGSLRMVLVCNRCPPSFTRSFVSFLNALRDLIVKTVESPFSMLASVVGAVGWSNQNLQHSKY